MICPPEKDGFPQQSSGDHRVCLHPHQCLFACHAEAPPDSSPNCLHTRSPTQLGTAHRCLVPIHHHFTLCLSASLSVPCSRPQRGAVDAVFTVWTPLDSLVATSIHWTFSSFPTHRVNLCTFQPVGHGQRGHLQPRPSALAPSRDSASGSSRGDPPTVWDPRQPESPNVDI